MVRILLFFVLFPHHLFGQFLSNPSFEGPTGLSVSPPGWYACGDFSTPDTQPTLDGWNFTKGGSDGQTYLGLVMRGSPGSDNEYHTEGCGTQFTQPLKKAICYSFKVDLSTFIDAQYIPNGVRYNNPGLLTVWISNAPCGKSKLLWSSPVISNEDWKTFAFQATMDDNYQYLLLEAEYADINNKVFGNILIDNFRIETVTKPTNLGNDRVVCEGFVTELTVPSIVDNVVWWNGSSDRTISVAGGIYWANLQVGLCSFLDTLVVNTVKSVQINLGSDSSLCVRDNIVLDAFTPFGTYSWSNGSTDPQITVRESGVYDVTVQNACNSASDEIKISYRSECCQLDVPNVFTPNDDTLNDVFEIRTESSLVYFHLVIYNRWGKQVFSTSEMKDFWNGKSMADQEVSTGVYFWVSDIKCHHSNEILEKTMRGSVTVFK